jgi:hypothetical protein
MNTILSQSANAPSAQVSIKPGELQSTAGAALVAEAKELTIREAEGFIASIPWRAVKMVEVGDTGKTPDPREYVIKGWPEVGAKLFDGFVRMQQPPRQAGAASVSAGAPARLALSWVCRPRQGRPACPTMRTGRRAPVASEADRLGGSSTGVLAFTATLDGHVQRACLSSG